MLFIPSLQDRLDSAIAEVKAALSPEQIDKVLALIQIFIEADRRGALVSMSDVPQDKV